MITNRETIQKYLNEVKKIEVITPAEMEILAQEALNGSEKSREKLIKANMRQVITLVKKYKVKGVTIEDLIAEGNKGVVLALNTYKLGNNFMSWANTYITRELINFISTTQHTVRVSNYLKKQGKEPLKINSFEEIKPGLDDLTYEDMLPGSTEQEEQEDNRDYNDNLKEVLGNLLPKLHPKHQQIIRMRYWNNLTYKECAEITGKTDEAMRLREEKALKKLRELL